MKRIIVLASFLLAASACTTTQAPSNTNAPTPAANTNTTAMPKAEMPATDSEAVAKEKQVWEAIKNKNYDGFAAMLTDNFIYVSNDGIHDKAATVNGIKQSAITDVTLSDWKTVMLDKDAAVVVYTASVKGTSGGEPTPTTPMRASSLWINRGGTWVAVYHQDTEVKEAPANQTAETAKPADKAPANANASASESTAAEASDPISKEKRIWEELKRKDYDAFASDLADDALEVSSSGVYDKAGSINGVKMFDPSQYSLSDFKETKIDADASIVTYMVKSRDGKEEERSSTIWAKRGEKWYAILHHSTPVAKPKK